MKITLILTGIFAFAASAFAADRQVQPDFMKTGTMTITGLSPSSWTLIVASTAGPTSRTAVWIDHSPNDTRNARIAITTSPVAPGTTVFGYVYQTSDNPWIVSLDRRLFLWGISETEIQQIISQEFQ